MARFVIIHGAWQGAWCWRDILPRLAARGHDAVAIDLPGHGSGQTAAETYTLREYAEHIAASVRTTAGPCLVMGHSAGGFLRQAAELVADRIAGMIFLSALVPTHGEAMMEFVKQFDPQYLAEFVWSADGKTARISAEGAKNFLFSHCPPEALRYALPRLVPEFVAPFDTPLSLTSEQATQIPAFYIECLQDRIVPIALQRAIASKLALAGVYKIDTGHAPYFSEPDELTAILDDIAKSV